MNFRVLPAIYKNFCKSFYIMDNLEVKNIDSETEELLEGVGKDYQTIFSLEKTYGYYTHLKGMDVKHGSFKVTVKKGTEWSVQSTRRIQRHTRLCVGTTSMESFREKWSSFEEERRLEICEQRSGCVLEKLIYFLEIYERVVFAKFG
ncbi:hypothetical protein D1R32_gp020 [Tunisvirus fontaine2]|uniref:Uncharacterized protein n=1 Tax=Tunisvirus fontaine2 TaxID=1421067 RepID=V9SG57_9VIRU|nr:hypothetical protein D1R32_gp020 [Tunisvirus fontaine2]AHC54737.1 hypothetical protein TNS_ORF19 [Tunisvirus fontaine2]